MPDDLLDAVVLAGGPSRPDAVCRHAGVDRKSLIRIAGQEMVLYVLQALADAGCVKRAIIVGLEREELSPSTFPLPIAFLAGRDNLMESARAGLEAANGERALLCASDIPLLTGEAIADFVARCARVDADIYYAIVEKSVLERRFPGAGRHYRPLRDGAYAGGDVLLLRLEAFTAIQSWFSKMFDARKSCLRLASLFGWDMVLAFLLHRLTLEGAERRISSVLRQRCKAIVSLRQLDLVSACITQTWPL